MKKRPIILNTIMLLALSLIASAQNVVMKEERTVTTHNMTLFFVFFGGIAFIIVVFYIIRKNNEKRFSRQESELKEDILDYIKDCRIQGFSDEGIRERLKMTGYHDHEIDRFFEQAFHK